MLASNYGLLSQSEIQAMQRPESWPIGIRDYVRFAELDILHHVNNKACMSWMENIRTFYFETLGIIFDPDWPFQPVLRMVQLDYCAALFLSEDYIILARTKEFGRTSFTMQFDVSVDNQTRLKAETTVVLVETKTHRPTPLTDNMREILLERDRATPREVKT